MAKAHEYLHMDSSSLMYLSTYTWWMRQYILSWSNKNVIATEKDSCQVSSVLADQLCINCHCYSSIAGCTWCDLWPCANAIRICSGKRALAAFLFSSQSAFDHWQYVWAELELGNGPETGHCDLLMSNTVRPWCMHTLTCNGRINFHSQARISLNRGNWISCITEVNILARCHDVICAASQPFNCQFVWYAWLWVWSSIYRGNWQGFLMLKHIRGQFPIVDNNKSNYFLCRAEWWWHWLSEMWTTIHQYGTMTLWCHWALMK